MNKLNGKEIKWCRTLKSMYDNDSIVIITTDEKFYRIKATEILKLLKEVNFKTRKARTHTYLEVN